MANELSPMAPGADDTADQHAEDQRLIVVDFAKPLAPLTWLAIAVGAALILFSILGSKPLAIAPHFANLMMGSGTAIILAGFGGQAVVRGKGYVFAGVAGIALGLISFLSWEDHRFRDELMHKLELQKKSYLVGRIAGLPVKRYSVHLTLDNFVDGRHLADLHRFDFVMFKEDLDKTASATLEIEDKENEDAPVNLEIPQRCLIGFLGQDAPLLWKFREEDATLIDERTGAIISAQFSSGATVAECQEEPPPIVQSDAWPSLSWVSTAFAGDVVPLSREEMDKALSDIQSADSDVRRGARITLSRAQPEDVAYILKWVRDRLAQDKNIYRTKLGVSLALTEMLRRDKALRDRMKFEMADLEMLLDFAGSDDRSLRIYAGEFLYDLESPEVAKLALPMALKATDDNARYNWILVSQGGWLKLPDEAKKDLQPVVEDLRTTAQSLPRTAELLQSFK
jgi:hypothetical protein